MQTHNQLIEEVLSDEFAFPLLEALRANAPKLEPIDYNQFRNPCPTQVLFPP